MTDETVIRTSNSRAHCRCGQFEDTDHACPVTHARLKAEIEGAHHDIDRLMAACTAEANEVERLRAHLRDIGSLATPEDSADDERQFARMREMVMAALGGSSETLCVADLIDCLEYKEDMAHVQVIEGKGALFWETLYAIKRGSQKANERPKCSGTMGCHVHWSGWPTHHPNCSDHPNNRSVKSEGDQRG